MPRKPKYAKFCKENPSFRKMTGRLEKKKANGIICVKYSEPSSKNLNPLPFPCTAFRMVLKKPQKYTLPSKYYHLKRGKLI